MPNPEALADMHIPGCLELIFNFLLLNFPQIHAAKPLWVKTASAELERVMPLLHVPPEEGGSHVREAFTGVKTTGVKTPHRGFLH